MEAFYHFIEQNKNHFLKELFQFLRQKSISATGEGMRETPSMLQLCMEEAGMQTIILPSKGYPAVYGEILASTEAPTVLIYGHYDVQPAEEDEWMSPPFEPVIREERIYCRGASDDKGQLFAHVKAVDAWRRSIGKLPVNVKFLFEGEEEIGSPHLDQLVRENRELLQCDLVIISDSHIHESGRSTIILGLKGMLYVELIAKGGRKTLHSKYAAVVESPVWRLIHFLESIRSREGHVLIDGFYDGIVPVSEAERRAIEAIPYAKEQIRENLGVEKLRTSLTYGSHYFWNMMFEPTCNIDGFLAGYTGNSAKTVLPSEAIAKLDFRLVPGQDPDRIYQLLEDHLDRFGFYDIVPKKISCMKPCRAAADSVYVNCIAQAIKAAWGISPLLYPSIGGSGPNHIFTEYLDVECITVPFAGADQNNHGANENLSVQGFMNGIRTGGTIMEKLSRLGGAR